MKKIILIPILLCSLSLFSQKKVDENAENAKYYNKLADQNAEIKAENQRLKAELIEFQKQIQTINNTLDLKADKTFLNMFTSSFSSKSEKMKQEFINTLMKKASSEDLKNIRKSLENKIEAANSNINENTALLDSASQNIKNILGTLEGQNINIQTTSGKVEKNNLYILLSFLLGVMLLITCIIIYRLTSKNKTNINTTKDQVKKMRELDNDLKNILEKHTKVSESGKEGGSQEETLKSLKIVADEIMTMENNIYQMTDEEQNSRGLKRIKRAIRNLRNNYKTMGYDIPILLGTEWKEGDIIEIVSELPDEKIEKGKRIITRVITPRIDFKGEMIQRAKVELKSNI
tara:strand:- start:2167 stop:3204 length:1038 start_codon:yes stop_codon:yes gene_type:complete